MTTPAVIFLSERAGELAVAGLSVLDRLVIAVHRSGCAPIIIVGTEPLPPLARSRALGIETQVAGNPGNAAGPALVAASNLLITEKDVRALLAANGRLVGEGGELLPAGVASTLSKSLSAALEAAPAVAASGVARVVEGAAQAREAERALWASLYNASDGVADRYFNRPLSRYLSRALVRTPVTPNQVTLLASLAGLVAAGFLARGTSAAFVWGAILFQVSAMIDCVDGDLARAVFKESTLGRWLDIVADQIVHVVLFLAIACGVARSGSEAPVLALGASAAVGVVLSFAVIAKRLSRSSRRGSSRVDQLIEKLTNRDFSVVLIGLALIDRVDVFLWLAAIGTHVFWLVALVAQRRDRTERQGSQRSSGGVL